MWGIALSSSDRGGPRVLWVLCVLVAACTGGPGSELEPRPQRLVPAWGLSTEPMPVSIEGENFLAVPTQHIGGEEPVSVEERFEAFLGEVTLEEVSRKDVRTLRARVPGGLALGWHPLVLVGPLGQRVELPRAYYVSDRPLARLQPQALLEKVQVSVEERTRLVLTVENTGGTDALAVTPVLHGTGEGRGVEILSEPGPAPIPVGARASFAWELRATASGDPLLTVDLQGREASAGVELLVRGVEAGPLRIREPAVLASALTTSQPVANVGQRVSLSLRVTNQGPSAALAVEPELPVVLGTAAMITSGPTPTRADIPVGESRDFTWTYIAGPEGLLAFETGAVGRDAHSGVEVRAPRVRSASITVRWPGIQEAAR